MYINKMVFTELTTEQYDELNELNILQFTDYNTTEITADHLQETLQEIKEEQGKDFLVKVEGVRDTTHKTKTELHITVRFQADHCNILHNSQMFCEVKSKELAHFIDNLITAEYGHVFNLVTMSG